jgi:hypothetical protein
MSNNVTVGPDVPATTFAESVATTVRGVGEGAAVAFGVADGFGVALAEGVAEYPGVPMPNAFKSPEALTTKLRVILRKTPSTSVYETVIV